MPKKVDHNSRREAFLAAANRTVRKKGVAAATVREVAKEAGYTTGALVHYIDSMDDLLIDASKHAARDWQREFSAIDKLPDGLRSLREILHRALPANPEGKANWDFFIGLWERSAQDNALRVQNRARYGDWLKRTTKLIESARKSGDIPSNINARRATCVLVALISGIAIQVTRAGQPLSGAEQRRIMDEWIINWLKPVRALGPLPAAAKKQRAKRNVQR